MESGIEGFFWKRAWFGQYLTNKDGRAVGSVEISALSSREAIAFVGDREIGRFGLIYEAKQCVESAVLKRAMEEL